MLHTAPRKNRQLSLCLELLEERLAPVGGATRIWSGGGANANWSTAANWGATGVPSSGDFLQFPASGFLTSTNDLVGLSLISITFTTGTGYTLAGNSLSVSTTITNNTTSGTNRINFDTGFASGAPTVDVAAGGSLVLAGVVSGVMTTLTKTGPGELVLTGNNTIDGFALSAGILTVGSDTATGTGSLGISGGTTLRADASARTLAIPYFIAIGAPVTLGGSSMLTLTGIGTLFGPTTFNVTNTVPTALNGDLRPISGSSTVTKTGAGTLVLGGTNTYGDTIVSVGTLLVNGTLSGGAVSILAGATLGGTGTVGPVTSTGGTVSPGVSPGLLTTGAVTLDAASIFRVELNGTTPGTGYDQLSASGPVTLGGSTLSASLGFAAAVGNTFVILRTISLLSGTFAGLANGTIFAIGGKAFRINYTAADVTLTRVQGSTTLALTANNNAPSFGQSVTFTATVSVLPSGGSTPTGSVNFRDGGTIIGTGLLNAAGQATFSTAGLTVGLHSIDANYGGDADYTGSTSQAQSVTVSRANTTLTLAASSNAPSFGQSVTFTATVSFPAGVSAPTGTVTFRDGGTVLGTGTLNGSGQATFATAGLSVGAHSIDATYGGDGNYVGSTAAAQSVSVSPAGTTLTLTVSSNATVFGQSVSFTATVGFPAGLNTPTGTVTFRDGGTVLGTSTLNANGQATFATTGLTVGAHTIDAVYGGDTSFAGSTSAAQAVTVNRASTTTVLTSSANPVGLNLPVTFTATVTAVAPGAGTPTGTVSFGAFPEFGRHPVRDFSPLGSAALTGGRAQLTVSNLPPGCRVIVATYAGDASFNASTSPEFKQTITASPNQAFVRALYNDVLERSSDISGFNFWVARLDAGTSRDLIAMSFFVSVEHRGIQVDTLYRTLLRRAADAVGRTTWVNALLAGVSEVEVAAIFAGSAEYAATHDTATAFVNGIYTDILNRAADSGGAAFWTPIVQSGARSRADVAYYFLTSSEAYLLALNEYFTKYLGRPGDPQSLADQLLLLEGGLTPTSIAVVFLGSAEYFNRAQIAPCA